MNYEKINSYSNGYITLGYKFFLEQAYLVKGLKVVPAFDVFILAHELVHAAVDSKKLGLDRLDNENHAVTEADKFVKEYNEKWGTKYQMRETYQKSGTLVFVGNGDLFSGSSVADSAPKVVAAQYEEIKKNIKDAELHYRIKEQLDRFEGLFSYKFQNLVAFATTSKELQAKAAFVKLEMLVNELRAKERKGPLTSQELDSALAAYESLRGDFLKALK